MQRRKCYTLDLGWIRYVSLSLGCRGVEEKEGCDVFSFWMWVRDGRGDGVKLYFSVR